MINTTLKWYSLQLQLFLASLLCFLNYILRLRVASPAEKIGTTWVRSATGVRLILLLLLVFLDHTRANLNVDSMEIYTVLKVFKWYTCISDCARIWDGICNLKYRTRMSFWPRPCHLILRSTPIYNLLSFSHFPIWLSLEIRVGNTRWPHYR